MWKRKIFKGEKEARAWMAENDGNYQMALVFIQNGCLVEYRKPRKLSMAGAIWAAKLGINS